MDSNLDFVVTKVLGLTITLLEQNDEHYFLGSVVTHRIEETPVSPPLTWFLSTTLGLTDARGCQL